MTKSVDAPEVLEEIELRGVELLTNPLYNKGTAFTEEERDDLGLWGLLPPHVDNIHGQINRAYQAFEMEPSDLEKYIFLRNLQDHNEVLFYRLLMEHIPEMMPIIYTPVVGEACQKFSHIFRQRRGIFVSYPDRHRIPEILNNVPCRKVRVIVVTDGERILGLGDQGTDGMGIPIGKLSLYSLCGGIDPATTLPIILDVGTDNEERLEDPLYIGWRNRRIRDQRYDDFVEEFVENVVAKFPGVLLQWEDFANRNARRLLERYRDRLCTFNDDIQGTAAVAVAAIMSALKVSSMQEADQNYVIFGAGSAGIGIAELLETSLMHKGLSRTQARERIWLVDRYGLIHSETPDLQEVQRPYARDLGKLSFGGEARTELGLLEVVRGARAGVLIGCSGQGNAFHQDVVEAMAANCERPIIFPLSNPNACCEGEPAQILAWSGGRALVATGSPFGPVSLDSGISSIEIGQCNNCYIFPGVGLGVIASGATRVTDAMFMKAAIALSELSPALSRPGASLLPALSDIRAVSNKIAFSVGMEAVKSGLSDPAIDSEEALSARLEKTMWYPRYKRFKFRSS
ncbi:MAG: NAD-dependent malic enzyme [Candidatus Obscuribacterales bacterium]|nr:NAD-dependent malic enzyme [Candidatus Obscuribacterales bacterium]